MKPRHYIVLGSVALCGIAIPIGFYSPNTTMIMWFVGSILFSIAALCTPSQ